MIIKNQRYEMNKNLLIIIFSLLLSNNADAAEKYDVN